MTHIMVDIESLGTRPGCVVLAAAFVRFSDEASTTLNLSVPDQQQLGLEIDPATQTWWTQQEQQHPGAWAAATSNAVPLRDALTHISAWLTWAEPDVFQRMIWCHGATFDAPILQELYRRAGMEPPWKFWNIQCTRTLYNLAGVDPKQFAVPPPHIALNDAIGQTRAANAALAVLGRVRGVLPSTQPIVTNCSVCHAPKCETTAGITCANGHGGADALAAMRAEMDRSIPF